MTREFLKNIKSENRLDKIRLIMKNDDVIGGQPKDDESFTSNTPFLDIACTMKFTIDAVTAAQKTASEAKTAASNADKKAAGAQTAATAADSKATTADGKAVAAQKAADEAKTAASNADKKAAGAQTVANTANAKAEAAQAKANQVPSPIRDRVLIGDTTSAYKLITKEELAKILNVPSVENKTGNSMISAISQKSFSDSLASASLERNGWWACGVTGFSILSLKAVVPKAGGLELALPISLRNVFSIVVSHEGVDATPQAKPYVAGVYVSNLIKIKNFYQDSGLIVNILVTGEK